MDDDFDFEKINWGKVWVIVFLTGLLIGGIILAWGTILGPAFNKMDYNNFNSSPQHVQAVAQKFSDDCLQLSETSDPVARKAIENDIYQQYNTVDFGSMVLSPGIKSCVLKAVRDVGGN